jgi:hypothetical protein
MLANGFWQAEGYIGGGFKSGLHFYPYCTAVQLLTYDSMDFFFRLNNSLSDKGTFTIMLNKQNNLVLSYRLSGWDSFFQVFVPYFYMVYGPKYEAIQKWKQIFLLKKRISNSPPPNLRDWYVQSIVSISSL